MRKRSGASTKRGPTRPRRWDPLKPAGLRNADFYETVGLTPPDAVYVNDLYSVFVRLLDGTDSEAMHISFHRHDRAATRDWRHFQAIKNEVAGTERIAIEIFPPESQLVDAANEYHLWVLPDGFPLPFVIPERTVMSQEEGDALYGPSKARQRPWEEGLPTGKNLETKEK